LGPRPAGGNSAWSRGTGGPREEDGKGKFSQTLWKKKWAKSGEGRVDGKGRSYAAQHFERPTGKMQELSCNVWIPGGGAPGEKALQGPKKSMTATQTKRGKPSLKQKARRWKTSIC